MWWLEESDRSSVLRRRSWRCSSVEKLAPSPKAPLHTENFNVSRKQDSHINWHDHSRWTFWNSEFDVHWRSMAASWFASQRWWFGYSIGCYSGIACISRFSWEHRRTPTSHPWEDGHLRRSFTWNCIRKLAEWDTCHSTCRFSFSQAKKLGQRWHRTTKNRVIGQLQQRPRSGEDPCLPSSTCRCVAQCPSDFIMWAQNEQWRHKSCSRISTWMSTLRTSLMSLRCSGGRIWNTLIGMQPKCCCWTPTTSSFDQWHHLQVSSQSQHSFQQRTIGAVPIRRQKTGWSHFGPMASWKVPHLGRNITRYSSSFSHQRYFTESWCRCRTSCQSENG